LRILVASDQWSPDFRGGSARIAKGAAADLVRRGHEVTALVPRLAGAPSRAVEDGVTVLRELRRLRLAQTLGDPIETFARARALRAGSWDVLVGHQPTTALGLACAFPDTPLAYVYHASVPRELAFDWLRLPRSRDSFSLALVAPVVAVLDRAALRRAARILVLSEFTRSLLRADSPAVDPRVVLVPGFVDVQTFEPGDGPAAARQRLGVEPDEQILLTVRRLAPRMGLEELIRALPLLRRWTRARLVIVGDGMLRDSLRRLVEQERLSDRVRLFGGADEAVLRDWYRAADLFVLPTLAYEGFGIATAEALASGTPVIGTPAGATPELLAPLDRRLVARSAEPPDLAAAIDEAAELATSEFGKRCREYALERFDVRRVGEAWAEALSAAAS
jgi:glycosyltransferase involved in cell wall biosynthesis